MYQLFLKEGPPWILMLCFVLLQTRAIDSARFFNELEKLCGTQLYQEVLPLFKVSVSYYELHC